MTRFSEAGWFVKTPTGFKRADVFIKKGGQLERIREPNWALSKNLISNGACREPWRLGGWGDIGGWSESVPFAVAYGTAPPSMPGIDAPGAGAIKIGNGTNKTQMTFKAGARDATAVSLSVGAWVMCETAGDMLLELHRYTVAGGWGGFVANQGFTLPAGIWQWVSLPLTQVSTAGVYGCVFTTHGTHKPIWVTGVTMLEGKQPTGFVESPEERAELRVKSGLPQGCTSQLVKPGANGPVGFTMHDTAPAIVKTTVDNITETKLVHTLTAAQKSGMGTSSHGVPKDAEAITVTATCRAVSGPMRAAGIKVAFNNDWGRTTFQTLGEIPVTTEWTKRSVTATRPTGSAVNANNHTVVFEVNASDFGPASACTFEVRDVEISSGHRPAAPVSGDPPAPATEPLWKALNVLRSEEASAVWTLADDREGLVDQIGGLLVGKSHGIVEKVEGRGSSSCLETDGLTGFVEFPGERFMLTDTGLTISCFMSPSLADMPTVDVQGRAEVLGMPDNLEMRMHQTTGAKPRHVLCEVKDGAAHDQVTDTAPWATNLWQMVSIVLDPTDKKMRFHRNGTLRQETALWVRPGAPAGPFRLGTVTKTTLTKSKFQLLSVFPRALTTAELTRQAGLM